jgi:DNA-binding NtrC family response regulator
MGEALEKASPELVVSCAAGTEQLVPRLARQLDGAVIQLPTLAERGEDLQALIINELSQLGLTERGAPFGIERAALYRLIERKYPGNDSELKGLLASAAGHAQGERVTLADLDAIGGAAESDAPPPVEAARARSRLGPRARRR